jgi:hypothetical protein
MRHQEDELLKVGDIIEFQRGGNPQPVPEWQPQVVTEIRILEEHYDKEGVEAEQVSWNAIRNYECMVIIVGTESWARNDQVRPVSTNTDARRPFTGGEEKAVTDKVFKKHRRLMGKLSK